MTTNSTPEKCSCICCGEVLDNLAFDFGTEGFQPSGGTAFKSYGHYGSTQFDNGSYLELVVCDDCLEYLLKCKVIFEGYTTAYKAELNGTYEKDFFGEDN